MVVSQVTDKLHHHLAVYLVVAADIPYELHFLHRNFFVARL